MWKKRIAELRQKYEDKVASAKGILESIKDGVLEDQCRGDFDKLMTEAEGILKSDEFKKLLDIESRAKRVEAAQQDDEDCGTGGTRDNTHEGRQTRSAQPSRNGRPDNGTRQRRGGEVDEEAYNEALGMMLRFGKGALNEEQRGVLLYDFTQGRERSETRGTMTSVGVADGAALVSPIMAASITEAMTVFTSLKEMGATVINQTNGAPMPFPLTDYTGNVAYEVGEGVEDSTEDSAEFGAADIPTYESITPMQYITRTLLNDTSYDILGYLQRKIILAFDALLAMRTVHGNGANKIKGLVFELTSAGHVVDTKTSQTFVDEDFATAQANVGNAYKFNPNCRFAFSPEFCANRFFKLAGGDGQYLYRQAQNKPGLGINGQMWTLLTAMADSVTLPPTPSGAACSLGEAGSAATITAGRIVALYGDASLYVIRNIQETLIERFEQETTAVRRRAVAFRGVRRIGGGWTSASTSAASRPMVALRVKS